MSPSRNSFWLFNIGLWSGSLLTSLANNDLMRTFTVLMFVTLASAILVTLEGKS